MSKMAALNDPSVVFYFFQKDIILLVSKIIWIKIKRLKFEHYALGVTPDKKNNAKNDAQNFVFMLNLKLLRASKKPLTAN